ncbi:hypothetical protein BH09PAT2_BH09PAT2_09780 [soil metagenome]
MSEIIHIIVLILHVIGATIIIGSSFVSLFVLIENKISKNNLLLIERMWRVVGPSLGIQLLTGVYLGISEWDEIGKNPLFWIKIMLYLVSGAIGNLVLKKRIHAGAVEKKEIVTLGGIKPWAIASFLIFVLIAICGVALAEGNS